MSAEGAMAPAKSQSNDALWPEKKSFSSEVQYISNIIENSINKIEIVATLPSLLQFHSLSAVVDKDLSRVLQEHEILNEKLKELDSIKEKSGGDRSREAEETSRRERALLEKDIKSSVRKVLRFFRANPNAFLSLRAEMDVEVGKSESVLIRALKTFHSHLIKLWTNLDRDPQGLSASVQSLENLNSEEETIAASIKKTIEESAEYESEIKVLQNYLKNIQEEDLSIVTDESGQDVMETSSTKLASLQHKADELKIQLKGLMLQNRQGERIIQEKNELLKKEIENLIQVFDDKMEETQTKLELIEKEYSNEQEAMKDLEKMFPALEVKYNEILEKRLLAEEKIREEKKELELKTKAAIIAQSWWRGYRTRMALKNKDKGKKGKKGKGRKTK